VIYLGELDEPGRGGSCGHHPPGNPPCGFASDASLANVQPQRIADIVIDDYEPATPRLMTGRLDEPAEP
jgi:hypothetical protein